MAVPRVMIKIPSDCRARVRCGQSEVKWRGRGGYLGLVETSAEEHDLEQQGPQGGQTLESVVDRDVENSERQEADDDI
jgi:hypothetical protein